MTTLNPLIGKMLVPLPPDDHNIIETVTVAELLRRYETLYAQVRRLTEQLQAAQAELLPNKVPLLEYKGVTIYPVVDDPYEPSTLTRTFAVTEGCWDSTGSPLTFDVDDLEVPSDLWLPTVHTNSYEAVLKFAIDTGQITADGYVQVAVDLDENKD